MISLFKKNSYKFTIISIVVLLGIGGIVFNIPQNNIALGANKDTTIETTKKSDLNISEIDVADKNYKGKMLVVKDPSSVKLGFDSKR